MNINSLSSYISEAAVLAAKRSRTTNIGDLWERLMDIDVVSVQEKIQQVRLSGWYGAIPTWEPLSTLLSATLPPLKTKGIDGSQIFPDPESPVYWAYVQGCVYSVGQKGLIDGDFINIQKLLDTNGGSRLIDLLSPDYTNSLRTMFEMRMIRDSLQQDDNGAVVLWDNPLLPYSNYGVYQQDWLKRYIDTLKSFQPGKVAGYVSCPQSHLLTNLIDLAENTPPANRIDPLIDDTQIMRYALQPGQRSALLRHGSRRNIPFENEDAEVYFFFIKLDEFEIGRVEIPAWIAKDLFAIEVVHSSIVHDSKMFSYPYSLFLAHSQVAIPLSLGEELNNLATRVFIENGGRFLLPAKKRLKGQLRP